MFLVRETWLSFTCYSSKHRLLNFGARLSELARRIAVERGGVSPMTADREEEEKAAAWEGEVTSQFAERVGGALDNNGQLCI